jgi:flagellar hook assembly protein FlgD
LSYENQRPTGQKLVAYSMPVAIGEGALRARAGAAGFTAKPLGSGLMFEIHGADDSRRARVSLVDMWGRTVWSHVAATSASGTSRVQWDGRANNGRAVSSGVYVARVILTDANGKTLRTLERKIPLTR